MRALRFATLIAALSAQPASAQLKPNANWRQIETRNFNIIYEAPLDSIARHTAIRAELEHARLSAQLIRAPRGKIHIVLADNTDITNGFASQFPDKRIVIWVRPPVDELTLQYYHDWIDLIVAHELTHIFHLDQGGRVGRGLRAAFGRVPSAWPLFPLLGTPRWSIEGLATLVESQHTGAGRVHGSYHEMVVRTDLLEQAFPTIDRVSGETPIWPGGVRAYIYGSLFMDYVARRYGDSAHTELIRKSAGSVLPPPWRMDAIAKKALGRSFREVYTDWRSELKERYGALADSLRRGGITETERVTTTGRWALHPRLSYAGDRLAYADENGRDVVATRIVDLASGADTRIRRNGLGPVAWLPADSGFITAQFEFVGRYEIYSDLFLVKSGREARLTRGVRAETPDVGPDGRRIVYVQNAAGTNRLLIKDVMTDAVVVLRERSPDVQWLLPRWSPDGAHIAVQKWTRTHGHDVVVLDSEGREVNVMRTDGLDAAPAWSPDGRYVLFSSDRTGISNLYAYDVSAQQLHQVTNVLTGAFYPEVSRDGRWIYFSAYHADGFHIERTAYDPATWRAPALVMSTMRPDTTYAFPFLAANARHSDPRAYSPIRMLLPKFWLPAVWGDTALSVFVGAMTAGSDDVGRHSYSAELGYDDEHARVAGSLQYSYAGFGNPVFTVAGAREWDYTGRVRIRNDAGEVVDTLGSYEREDRVSLTASVVHRQWRASRSVVFGVEGVVFNRRLLGPASFRDPQDRLLGVLGGFSFANYRTPALSISPEDGVRLNTMARRRIELDPGDRDRSYTELLGSGAAYKSVGGSRFAHDVLTLRVSALHRTALGRGPTDVGGVVDFLPVRGFDKNSRVGFTAWTGSLEYRMPLALIGRGYRLRPFFIDRIAAAFFADAGNASCGAEQRELYLACPGVNDNPTQPLVSAGFELSANVAVLVFLPAWLRAGIAFPLKGGDRNAKIYFTFGPSF